VLRDILKDVQTSLVPRTIVREWAANTFQSATDYWTFRKVMLSLAAAQCPTSMLLTAVQAETGTPGFGLILYTLPTQLFCFYP